MLNLGNIQSHACSLFLKNYSNLHHTYIGNHCLHNKIGIIFTKRPWNPEEMYIPFLNWDYPQNIASTLWKLLMKSDWSIPTKAPRRAVGDLYVCFEFFFYNYGSSCISSLNKSETFTYTVPSPFTYSRNFPLTHLYFSNFSPSWQLTNKTSRRFVHRYGKTFVKVWWGFDFDTCCVKYKRLTHIKVTTLIIKKPIDA